MSETTAPDSPKCLADAGCSADQIEAYERLKAEGDREGCMRLLRRQRAVLVSRVHEAQKPLDVLDYIMYHVKREGN